MSPTPSAATAAAVALPAGSHIREHGSILAAAEKRLLVWMAERLPARINADHLTAWGAVAMVGAGAAFAAASVDRRALALVPIMLFLNWFGDSLDGTVARVRGHQRPRYGYYLDHVVDVVNTAALFLGMAASELMHPLLGMGVLLGYVMLCAESFLATHALGVFRISFSGVGPTELRILLSVGALVAMSKPVVTPFGLAPVPLFDVGGAVTIVGMAVAFTMSAWRNARTLYRLEPLPSQRTAPAMSQRGER
jgi:archaetidylinositol phosphate synthase